MSCRPTIIFIIVLLNCLCVINVNSQEKIAEISSVHGFSKNNEAAGYYVKKDGTFIINQQDGRQVHRLMYDSNFKLLNSYNFKTTTISFNKNHINTPVFATDMQLAGGIYEVFADKNTLLVVAPDFLNKKDSVLYTLQLSTFEQEEKRLAIMPYSKGIRVLCYLQKKKSLRLYQWEEGGKTDSADIALPTSSLSEEEIKKYSKDARVKYKDAFDNLFVCKADGENIIGSAGTNSIYYSEEKAWLLSQTPFYTGYNILEFSFDSHSLESFTIMINGMRKNNTAGTTNIMHPYAAIVSNYLFVRNTSNYYFEYHIYDLRTRSKLKEFIAEDDKSIRKIVHSDFNQKGTWFSANDEKKLENDKAFMRKVNSGVGFIALSENGPDSVTITTGSLNATSGLGGLLLSIGTGMMGYMANFTIGNFQIVPYLESYRNKMLYCHSRFSKATMEPSAENKVTTALDLLVDNFDRRDLKSSSSFLIRKQDMILAAVFNPESKRFDLFKLSNGQSN